jgi:AcrR family transcriptional regulator
MGRRPDPRRKAELLDALVEYLLKHGLAELSLRPLAAALETSPRTLLYHFRSREEMIAAAINEFRKRHLALVNEEMRRHPPESAEQGLKTYWNAYTAKKREPFLRLQFEVWGLALQNPKRFKEFLDGVSIYYTSFEEGLVLQGLSREQSRTIATQHMGTIRGLMLDLLTTGDRKRIDKAIDRVARDLRDAVEEGRRAS